METQPVVTQPGGLATATPSPEESDDDVRRVCVKVAELVEADPALPAAAKAEAADIDTCVVEATKDRETDPEKFARQSACVLEGSTMQEAIDCVLRDSGAATNPPEGSEARVRKVCEKMLQLPKANADIPAGTIAELDDLDMCVEEGLDAIVYDPAEFDLVERCTLGASSMKDAIGCMTETSPE